MAFGHLCLSWICTYLFLAQSVNSLPEPGRWTFTITQDDQIFGVPKSLYKGSTISISVSCSPDSANILNIGWVVRQTPCYEDYLGRLLNKTFMGYYDCPFIDVSHTYSTIRYLKIPGQDYTCKHFDLKATSEVLQTHETAEECRWSSYFSSKDEKKVADGKSVGKSEEKQPENLPEPVALKEEKALDRQKRAALGNADKNAANKSASAASATTTTTTTTTPKTASDATTVATIPNPKQTSDHQLVLDQDGVYLLIIYVKAPGIRNMTAVIDIKMQSELGYLSAVDWPLLPFYGVMCGLYVIYAIVWLTVSALQWRDLLRIQFWIGGLIFLGLVEKAAFLNEYQTVNSTGETGHAGMLFAEVVSCLKRTLARLLVIIVSLGFGVVKPRLGPALHRIVGVGSLYFLLSTVEGCLRVLKGKNDPSNQTIMAQIPLAVLDSAICWWIFSSLVQTTRTLRLRRNIVKLGLYRHFTNALVFSVLASVVYMIWTFYNHRLYTCITDWKELWVDEAYWHLLFSLILMVIMVLWRPTNNNQRYAFTPLLDALDDDDEDNVLDKENSALNDIYGTKARNSSGTVVKGQQQTALTESVNSKAKDHKEDENLKWVEENIPSSLTDTVLPSLLDSDEEIMTVRYERNKME